MKNIVRRTIVIIGKLKKTKKKIKISQNKKNVTKLKNINYYSTHKQ